MSSATPVQIPYFAPTSILSAPLPTIDEISSSAQTILTQKARRVVARIGAHYVVKYGLDIDFIEGQNMLFIKQLCSVKVPLIYAMFYDHTTGVKYIIMEHIMGENLMSLWERLDTPAKSDIATKLHAYFQELRQVPGPGYYSKLGGQGYFDEIFMSLDEHSQGDICGPFETGSQLIDAIVRRYTDSTFPQRGEYLRRILPSVLRDSVPVLTHNDLQRKNIIVKADGVVFVVDWESAAFYPEYYEYYSAMTVFGHYTDDWHVWVGQFLREYPVELGWLDTIRRELF